MKHHIAKFTRNESAPDATSLGEIDGVGGGASQWR